MSSQLLTPTQLADELQVPLRTLERWRNYGTGPTATRVGRHVRYSRADVDRWLNAQRDTRRAS